MQTTFNMVGSHPAVAQYIYHLPPYRQFIHNISCNYLPKPVIKDFQKCFCKLRKWHSSLGFATGVCPEIGGVQTLDFIYIISKLSDVL